MLTEVDKRMDDIDDDDEEEEQEVWEDYGLPGRPSPRAPNSSVITTRYHARYRALMDGLED